MHGRIVLAGVAAGVVAVAAGVVAVAAVSPSAGSPAPRVEVLTGGPEPAVESRALQAMGSLPLAFVENRGQADPRIRYQASGGNLAASFTSHGLTLSLSSPAGPGIGLAGPAAAGWTVTVGFEGGRTGVLPRGARTTSAMVSYFRGARADWTTAIPTYSEVRYDDVWPGIDVRYAGGLGKLKYSFRIEPGADPLSIGIVVRGATSMRPTATGGLEVSTPLGGFTDRPPTAYQVVEGLRVPVEVSFAPGPSLAPGVHGYGFRVGPYDRSRPLVIDPEVVWTRLLGGPDFDQGFGIALDPAGNVYVSGRTKSPPTELPAKVGPDLTPNGDMDAFVAKLSADGTELLYAGYLGGEGKEQAFGVAVDADGAAYVTGETSSVQGFPVTVGPDLTFNGGGSDAFVVKVAPSGTSLEYAGYLGGSKGEEAKAIAVDAAGAAYVTGFTFSDEEQFPVTVGPNLSHSDPGGRSDDAFVAKVSPSGEELVYAGYIGGVGSDGGRGIAVDPAGNAYVTGVTHATEDTFPVAGGPDLTYNGAGDVFVARVDASGAFLDYAGYIGGAGFDEGKGVAVDGLGRAHVTGFTGSSETTFPIRVGPDLTYNGGGKDAFVARVSGTGQSLEYAGYVGGAGSEEGFGAAVDGEGALFVSGRTDSDEATFPATIGPDLVYNGGVEDAFVAKVAPSGSSLEYAGYIGGKRRDHAGRVALDGAGNPHLVGQTYSSKFAPDGTPGHDATYAGGGDVFVVAVGPAPPFLRCDPSLTGGPGPDTIVGTPGPDHICGGGGDDVLYGKGGDDILDGGPGNDRILGGGGADEALGGPGDDVLSGQAGPDGLHGGAGNDRLFGGVGGDLLRGQLGDDQLWGGRGDDTLRGGGGHDRCVDGQGSNLRFGCES